MTNSIPSAVLKTLIDHPAVKAISFAALGTLLVQPIVKPADLLFLLERKARVLLSDGHFPLFEARVAAERTLLERGKPPVLSDIYDFLVKRKQLSRENANEILDMELRLQESYFRARASQLHTFQYAVRSGKQIVTVDETVLPVELIGRVLVGNGLHGVTRHYASSSPQGSKLDGSLFRTVLFDCKLQPDELLHIGTDLVGDEVQPGLIGIRTHLIHSSISAFKQCNSAYEPWKTDNLISKIDPAFRLPLGMIANTLFDAPSLRKKRDGSVFNGDPYTLGYYAVGPFLLYLSRWIIKNAIIKAHDTVSFIARDGYLVKKAYDLLRNVYRDAPESKYLRISRAICLPFDMGTNASVAFNRKILNLALDMPVSKILTQRLGLELDNQILKQLANFGIDVSGTLRDYPNLFDQIASSSIDVKSAIERRKERYTQYYRKEFHEYGNIGLFDIGYNARSQRVLSEILGKAIDGYYISSFHNTVELEESGHSISNYLGPAQNRWAGDIGFRTALLEIILSEHESGSIIDIECKDGVLEPVLDAEEMSKETEQLLDTIQSGAMDLVAAAISQFGDDIDLMPVAPNSAFFLLRTYMTSPSPKDARLFENVAFSNAAMGKAFFMIAQTEKQSHWREGFAALHRSKAKTWLAQRMLAFLHKSAR